MSLPLSVRPSIAFTLNDFFSNTTELISIKVGRKHLWRMGIQVCDNQGAGTYWDPTRGRAGQTGVKCGEF